MPVLSHQLRERRGFDYRFIANDNDRGGVSPAAARDIAPGEPWVFAEHRTMAEVIAAERRS